MGSFWVRGAEQTKVQGMSVGQETGQQVGLSRQRHLWDGVSSVLLWSLLLWPLDSSLGFFGCTQELKYGPLVLGAVHGCDGGGSSLFLFILALLETVQGPSSARKLLHCEALT